MWETTNQTPCLTSLFPPSWSRGSMALSHKGKSFKSCWSFSRNFLASLTPFLGLFPYPDPSSAVSACPPSLFCLAVGFVSYAQNIPGRVHEVCLWGGDWKDGTGWLGRSLASHSASFSMVWIFLTTCMYNLSQTNIWCTIKVLSGENPSSSEVSPSGKHDPVLLTRHHSLYVSLTVLSFLGLLLLSSVDSISSRQTVTSVRAEAMPGSIFWLVQYLLPFLVSDRCSAQILSR